MWVYTSSHMRPALIFIALLLTTTAPAQWQIQSAPTTADLRGIHALSLPFVVGPHGRVGRLSPTALPSAVATKQAR